jgi:tRNA threonylcarbamoyladenosine biosynthesis protein TsaE
VLIRNRLRAGRLHLFNFKSAGSAFEMNCLERPSKCKGVVLLAIFQKNNLIMPLRRYFRPMQPHMLTVSSLAALPAAAARLQAAIAAAGCSVVAFEGEMGAGKTTLIRTLCAALGVADEVSSPTFALVNEYRDTRDTPIYHFDFYRIGSIVEAEQMGATEYLDSGYLCLVEWPARVAALLPVPYLEVRIQVMPDETREIGLKIIN